MKNSKKKGFTIVELVIVIGVIGILSGILIPTFVNLTQEANKAALKSNLANAYSMYVADAADGKVDDYKSIVTTPTPTSGEYVFVGDIVAQEKVFLVDASKTSPTTGYAFINGNWSTEETALGTASSPLVKLSTDTSSTANLGVKYGGYVIYKAA